MRYFLRNCRKGFVVFCVCLASLFSLSASGRANLPGFVDPTDGPPPMHSNMPAHVSGVQGGMRKAGFSYSISIFP